MLIPHLHLAGRCREAMALYEKALDATTDVIYYVNQSAPEEGVDHAEMHIHGQRVMLNDNGGNPWMETASALQLIVLFDTVAALKEAYARMEEGSVTLSPMAAASYTPCTVGFLDRFGVRWSFMVA